MTQATAGAPLTEREREIAALIPSGLTSQQIGRRLFISGRTVDSHLASIYVKTGTRSRVQLTNWLIERGGIPAADARTH